MYLEILCCPWRAVAVTSNRWEQRFDSASAGPEAGLPGNEFQGRRRRRREVSRRWLSGSAQAKQSVKLWSDFGGVGKGGCERQTVEDVA